MCNAKFQIPIINILKGILMLLVKCTLNHFYSINKYVEKWKYYIKLPGLGGIEVGFDMRAGPVVIVAAVVGE